MPESQNIHQWLGQVTVTRTRLNVLIKSSRLITTPRKVFKIWEGKYFEMCCVCVAPFLEIWWFGGCTRDDKIWSFRSRSRWGSATPGILKKILFNAVFSNNDAKWLKQFLWSAVEPCKLWLQLWVFINCVDKVSIVWGNWISPQQKPECLPHLFTVNIWTGTNKVKQLMVRIWFTASTDLCIFNLCKN